MTPPCDGNFSRRKLRRVSGLPSLGSGVGHPRKVWHLRAQGLVALLEMAFFPQHPRSNDPWACLASCPQGPLH